MLNECPDYNALRRELVLASKPTVETATLNPKTQTFLGESWFLFLLALAWQSHQGTCLRLSNLQEKMSTVDSLFEWSRLY